MLFKVEDKSLIVFFRSKSYGEHK